MLIRPAHADDAAAIWSIIGPIIRPGETYTLDPMMSETDALAYWMGPDKETFVAEDKGILALLWQIIRGPGFPNQIFSDSWVVGLMEGRPWRSRGQVGNASLGDGSSLSWSVWVTRRGSGCVRFMWLG